MKKLLPPLLGLLLFHACQSEVDSSAEAKVDLKTELPGIWEIVLIKVQVNTFDNRDTTVNFEIREENWERQYQAKQAHTYFLPENTYRREFRALSGDTISVSRGIWNVFGDTLMLIEPDTSYQFLVKIAQGMSELRRKVDWDGDGQEDDDYLEMHRRISKTTN